MTVEIETEKGGRHPEASEELLERLLSQMTVEDSFLIVHRTDRPEDHYAQTSISRRTDGTFVEGRWVVEYRQGPSDHHQAFTTEPADVQRVLAGWAFDRDGWRDGLDWRALDLGF